MRPNRSRPCSTWRRRATGSGAGATRCRRSRQRARLAPDNEDIWFALRGHLLLFQREEEAFDDFRRFEPNAALSARIVAAGLLSARIAPGIDYENKYLPLALDWPYQPGEGAYAAVAVAQAQYFDVTREQLLRVYQAHDRVRQAERGSIADFAAPLHPPGPLDGRFASATCRPISART